MFRLGSTLKCRRNKHKDKDKGKAKETERERPPARPANDDEHPRYIVRTASAVANLLDQIEEVGCLYRDLDLKMAGTNKRVKAGDATPKKLQPRVLHRTKRHHDFFADQKALLGPKSKLIDADLHGYFANPEAWNTLEDHEKAEVRSLLPDTIPFTDDGAPSPEFLKHNNDWRNGIRQFQEDIENGRYDPKWQEEAAQAMEERAAGAFDDYKEQHYEEFWGQKQKVDHRAIAGESAKVKLEDLIAAGLFCVGDTWAYCRVIRRKHDSALIEKDCTIVGIADNELTFSIPPGQLKLASTADVAERPVSQCKNRDVSSAADNPLPASTSPDASVATPLTVNSNSPNTEGGDEPADGIAIESTETKIPTVAFGMAPQQEDCDPKPLPKDPPVARNIRYSRLASTDSSSLSSAISSPSMESFIQSSLADYPARPKSRSVEPMPSPLTFVGNEARTRRSAAPVAFDGPILHTAKTPQNLADRIVEIDGRIERCPAGNAWKFIRCRRDNQDMGSLWEMRQAYWIQTHPGY